MVISYIGVDKFYRLLPEKENTGNNLYEILRLLTYNK